ncbi:hypothetical protein HYH03_002464 [Edaphochlamys debaryana]|uniref:Uncharacterized protein n=1 Tax=Edaphochlamys debaryana TaxID=47281 RepID=A0A835YAU4_9CHLO|nr:hypothetical protein HYH03_002464 [Edaphochlamys debaryana]|eukprot:KAG2499517.1 hypothetical protein HYH03_002464 [Edaphochlamys debaryana]
MVMACALLLVARADLPKPTSIEERVGELADSLANAFNATMSKINMTDLGDTLSHGLNATLGDLDLNATLSNLTATLCDHMPDSDRCREGAEKERARDAYLQRPRVFGARNSRGEAEWDDRNSPRKVAFLGRSPNLRIYPNYSDPSVYLQLKFVKLVELDANGRPVPRHAVPSLAEALGSVAFTAGNTSINGVSMSFATVTVTPAAAAAGGAFRAECGNASAGAQRRQRLARALLEDAAPAPVPQVNITLLFGLDGTLTLPYGPTANVSVPPNGLKWTVSVRDWPFCGPDHTLAVALSLALPGNATATVSASAASASARTQLLRLDLGSGYSAALALYDFALDGPDGAQRMPVNVTIRGAAAAAVETAATANGTAAAGNETVAAANGTATAGNETVAAANGTVNGTVAAAGVETETEAEAEAALTDPDLEHGGVMVVMNLPNPASYNRTTVWYDPTQATTSPYLSASDPGNTDIAATLTASTQSTSTTSTTAGGDTGAAGGLRAGLWAVLGAALLAVAL